MAPLRSTVYVCFIFSLLLAQSAYCLKHKLHISNDNRKRFFIENFGFEAEGQIHMKISSFLIGGKKYSAEAENKVGFLIKRSETDSAALGTDETTENKDCTLEEFEGIVVPIDVASEGVLTEKNYTIKPGEEGFYNTYFISCVKDPVSFELVLVQYNVDRHGHPNYLSSGYSPLPTIYGVFTVAYGVMLLAWVLVFLRGKGNTVNRIHHLMTVLVILKMLSLMFKTIEYHFIKTTGSSDGWNIPYYIFTMLKGIMLFVLIALIGTGWSFIKPFLNDKDKKIFLVVIPLQILDNIALIIIEESAPGSQGWFTWKDIFRLVDIICCGAILVPIIWSIKHLREASSIDGKAARNIHKLKLFRQFYLMVVSYIYFTRIIVYLVDAALPFRLVWMGDFFTELATVLFFSVTGYKFKPAPDNPYFQLEEDMEAVDSMEMTKPVAD